MVAKTFMRLTQRLGVRQGYPDYRERAVAVHDDMGLQVQPE